MTAYKSSFFYKYILILFLGFGCSFNLQAKANTKKLDEKAEDFTLKSKQHGNLKLAEQKGQVIMLNFWASWCGPCRAEMPLLEKLQKKYAKHGFSVWGVNTDSNQKMANKVLKDMSITFPILYDTDSSVFERYKVDAMPSSIFIDRNGKKRWLHRGFVSGDEKSYEKIIRQLIRE